MASESKFHLGTRLHFFRRQIVEGLVAKGMSQDEAEDVVGKIGDGTLLQWLITHGPDIIAFIMQIMALFPK